MSIEPKRAASSPVHGRGTLKDQCYLELRRALIAGRYAPGEQVTVKMLADQLDATTMPVREAVQRLVAEGALVNLPNGRVRVPQLDRGEFRELIDIRRMLEPSACSKAAERASTQDVERVQVEAKRLEDLFETGTDLERRVTNLKFHFAIYEAARSPHLLDLIELIWLRFGPMIPHLTPGRPSSADYFRGQLRRHRELVDALWARDQVRAAEAMTAIIGATEDHYLQTRFVEQEEGGSVSFLFGTSPPRT